MLNVFSLDYLDLLVFLDSCLIGNRLLPDHPELPEYPDRPDHPKFPEHPEYPEYL